MNRYPLALAAAALVSAAVAAGVSVARANGATCTAWIGGLESTKTAVPELVVFNPGGTPLSLTLTMRDPAGAALAIPAGTVDVPGFHTVFLSLATKLTTAGPSGKPYSGRFSLEIAGGPPFDQQSAVVHVTQYFGARTKQLAKPVKPASAFIVRPLFNPVVN